MKIAVIGPGIAGLGAALGIVRASHDVRVFEKATGASAAMPTRWTSMVDIGGPPVAVDTGFIVYNERSTTPT